MMLRNKTKRNRGPTRLGGITVRNKWHEQITKYITKLQEVSPKTWRCLGPFIVIHLLHRAQLLDEVEP
jgi:hypothetical protein